MRTRTPAPEPAVPRRGQGVAERKPFLLRLSPEVLEALQRWAADDLRSLNGQIEFLLRRSLAAAGRAPRDAAPRRKPPG